MGFIMDGLGAEAYDRTYDDLALVRRIARYFRPYLGIMALVSASVLLNSLMDAALPVLISTGVDRNRGPPERRAVVAIRRPDGRDRGGGGGCRGASTSSASGTRRVRSETWCSICGGTPFDAVMARDMSFYDEFPSGKIVSRVTSDTQDFATVVTLSLNLASQLLQVAIVVAVLFYVNAWLATVTVAIAPFVVAIALGFRAISRGARRPARGACSPRSTPTCRSR